MEKVTLGGVTTVNHMVIELPRVGGSAESGKVLEIYTGWVTLDRPTGSSLVEAVVESFIPVADSTLKFWPDNWKVRTTVTVSPASFALQEEATITAVNGAEVVFRKKRFAGIAGEVNCMVLRTLIGQMNSSILNYTYQVCARSDTHEFVTQSIDPGETP
jgi:hypothetical protein